jgi:hypothetical protein
MTMSSIISTHALVLVNHMVCTIEKTIKTWTQCIATIIRPDVML